ncbi:MAG TPA: dihydrofolate reductase family protein [Thermoanaerobaculia bacterium]|nr:dihydrofolate reductase family protein [Thermoanaerobaculia bacterium]
MRRLISHMQVTLDGFVAGPNGELDWSAEYHDEAMWEDVFDLLSNVDAVLFGRVTYQLFEEYWPVVGKDPSATKRDVEFGEWIDETPKLVVSRTLTSVKWKNTTLIRGDGAAEVAKIKEADGNDILIFGSGTLVSSLMSAGLVDEHRTNVHPVILGDGKRLAPSLNGAHPLQLVDARKINAGVVGLHHRKLQVN